MGTNFFLHEVDGRGLHIGKRSAAGLYCWDCGVTLCKGGQGLIHHCSDSWKWFDKCPMCGNEPREETLGDGAAGKELGFNRRSLIRTGVGSCCSFSWAVVPHELFKLMEKCKGRKPVVDEYERLYTIRQFREMLKDCAIMYFQNIGQEFC